MPIDAQFRLHLLNEASPGHFVRYDGEVTIDRAAFEFVMRHGLNLHQQAMGGADKMVWRSTVGVNFGAMQGPVSHVEFRLSDREVIHLPLTRKQQYFGPDVHLSFPAGTLELPHDAFDVVTP
jgi:hypothetical protein